MARVFLILMLLPILSPKSMADFEYRCLKSGMTKLEFHQKCQTETVISQSRANREATARERTDQLGFDATRTVYEALAELTLESLEENIRPSNPILIFDGTPLAGSIAEIIPSWTQDQLLWRIQLSYRSPSNILREIAFREALMQRFPEEEIQESVETETVGSLSLPSKYFSIVLVDQEISDSAVEKIREEISPQL